MDQIVNLGRKELEILLLLTKKAGEIVTALVGTVYNLFPYFKIKIHDTFTKRSSSQSL